MTEKAIFAAGCFWGVEAGFLQVPGVLDVTSGYTGGHTEHPTYREVCAHGTGHAEAVEVLFDPSKVRYDDLVAYFWRMHDPTQVNRQGPDIGSQYRSAIFVLSPEQREIAEASKRAAQASFSKPIATEIVDATTFWPAEAYHQRYFERNAIACHVPAP